MKLDTSAILSKTPREFSILMAAEVERKYDEYEMQASQAMMMRAAYHKEKLRFKDLFKRPNNTDKERTSDDVKRHQNEVLERLSRFEEFADKLGRKEETD